MKSPENQKEPRPEEYADELSADNMNIAEDLESLEDFSELSDLSSYVGEEGLSSQLVPYEGMEDEEVIDLYREGDLIAQEYLISKYKNFVRSKARSYFLIGADKEDIIQEGMIGLYKAIRDYRGDKQSSFRAFADLCITRHIITAIKTATRQKHIPLNSYVSLNKPIYDE